MPKLNQKSCIIVCQAKTRGVRAFVHQLETLKGRLSLSATDAKRPVVHQGRLSTLAGDAKEYLDVRMRSKVRMTKRRCVTTLG